MNIKKYFVTAGTFVTTAAIALLAAAPSFAAASSNSSASFNTSLGYGSSGAAVLQLQNFLISQNCLSTAATGYFGALTTAGVKCFQTKYGIVPTGYFGVLSRNEAGSVTPPGTTYATATPAYAPATISTTSVAKLVGTQIQSAVNLSQGALAPASITPLAGYGNATLPPASTSPYGLSPLIGNGQYYAATTSLSQGANATPALSPLINQGSH